MTLQQVIEALPVDVQREVQDFAEYLLRKQGSRARARPTFSWAGILADERRVYSAVELQHHILSSERTGS